MIKCNQCYYQSVYKSNLQRHQRSTHEQFLNVYPSQPLVGNQYDVKHHHQSPQHKQVPHVRDYQPVVQHHVYPSQARSGNQYRQQISNEPLQQEWLPHVGGQPATRHHVDRSPSQFGRGVQNSIKPMKQEDEMQMEYECDDDDNINIEYDYKEVGNLCKEFREFIEDWKSRYDSTWQIIGGDTATKRNPKLKALKEYVKLEATLLDICKNKEEEEEDEDKEELEDKEEHE